MTPFLCPVGIQLPLKNTVEYGLCLQMLRYLQELTDIVLTIFRQVIYF